MRVTLIALALALAQAAVAQPKTAGPADPKLIEELILANRILAMEGVVDAMGHVSVRHSRDPNRYLISLARAPELVTAEDIAEYDLDSKLVGPSLEHVVGRAIYLEVGAKLQAQAMALGGPVNYLDPEEGKKIEARRDYVRSWELWRRKAMGK